jgi:GH15 family glucan-1,4-alpha-glucosidase
VIGNAHTAALIATDGSIDWCCWPYFDSPAVFCRLLDAVKGGSFRVGPTGQYAVTRAYQGPTNVLSTTFTTSSGRFRITDLMPIQRGQESRRILRLVEGLGGEVEFEIRFRPTFDYAHAETTINTYSGGAVARAGHETLALACPVPLQVDAEGGAGTRRWLHAGERFWLTLTYQKEPSAVTPPAHDPEAALAQTLDYWGTWASTCTYHGRYRDLVLRSALTLKLLTFEPSGALIAAPTTSLPEAIGGVRNWDYRYTWLRDSALILDALQAIGYHDEAMRFWGWLEDLAPRFPKELQIMYRIDGSPELPERILDHLEGYRQSRPVRIGNAGARQTQLDAYGEVLNAACICHLEMGHPVRPELGMVLRTLADQAARRWREPDYSIWEVRNQPQHFLYSKLLCWVALDRAMQLAKCAALTGNVHEWQQEREAIRRAILTHGYNKDVGAFTQAFGSTALDASALAIPLVGFLPATDPRVRSTIEQIQRRLTANGLVHRYLTDDGLPGGEAIFALSSFWLVDNLALTGRIDEARALFERIVGYANDVGLLSEEIEPESGDLLGNYPQGFTHLALIRSALALKRAEERPSEDHAGQLPEELPSAHPTKGHTRSWEETVKGGNNE